MSLRETMIIVTTGNNDHRVIGRKLDLFHLQDDAAGSVFWHPKGQALYRVIEDYIRGKLARNGYQEVRSPQLFHHSLFQKSGHLDHYADNMFKVGEQHMLKPMNCPAHVQIFNANMVLQGPANPLGRVRLLPPK
jgi:threonyl-tRNA synthetase